MTAAAAAVTAAAAAAGGGEEGGASRLSVTSSTADEELEYFEVAPGPESSSSPFVAAHHRIATLEIALARAARAQLAIEAELDDVRRERDEALARETRAASQARLARQATEELKRDRERITKERDGLELERNTLAVAVTDLEEELRELRPLAADMEGRLNTTIDALADLKERAVEREGKLTQELADERARAKQDSEKTQTEITALRDRVARLEREAKERDDVASARTRRPPAHGEILPVPRHGTDAVRTNVAGAAPAPAVARHEVGELAFDIELPSGKVQELVVLHDDPDVRATVWRFGQEHRLRWDAVEKLAGFVMATIRNRVDTGGQISL